MTFTGATAGGLTTHESPDALLAAVADEEFVILGLTDLADLTGELRSALGLPTLRLLGQHVAPPPKTPPSTATSWRTSCWWPMPRAALPSMRSPRRGSSRWSIAIRPPNSPELHRRMSWDVENRGRVGLFLFVEMALRSFRAAIREIRSRLDDLEDAMLVGIDRDQLVELSGIHRRISQMRRSMGEYGDAVVDLDDVFATGPRQASANLRLLRAHGLAVRGVLNALNTLRDEAANVMDLYRSLTTTRQSLVINRLTVISALLLPLTFVTGFFGMNVGWLGERIESGASFWLLGVAVPAVVATAAIALMWRAGCFAARQRSRGAWERTSERQRSKRLVGEAADAVADELGAEHEEDDHHDHGVVG